MVLRARKVSGAFEKWPPGPKGLRLKQIVESGSDVVKDEYHCLKPDELK